MEEITALQIIKFSENLWGFKDSTMPVDAEPNLADVYAGVAEGDYVSFTTRNGSNIYNRIPASIITYVDEVTPANNFGPVSALELIQYLKTDGFFGSGSGGEGETPTLQGLANSLIPNLVGRNGQFVVISGTGFTTQTLPEGFIQNNIPLLLNFGNVPGSGGLTIEQVIQFLFSKVPVFPLIVYETQTPVIFEFLREGKRYLYVFKNGKGIYHYNDMIASDFFLLSVVNTMPEDIDNDPNAVITNLDPVTDGDYIDKANLTQWDFTDSGNTQPDGGVKTYYFTYTQDGVLYFVQFIGEQGEYGGGISPDLTEDMFAAVTNSNETPEKTKLSEFINDGDGTSPFVTEYNIIPQENLLDAFVATNSSVINNGKYNGISISFNTLKNTLGFIYRESDNHISNNSVLKMMRSFDRGKTFETTTIIDHPTLDVRNPAGGTTPTGRIVLFYLEYDAGATNPTISQKVIYSDDEGTTWSDPFVVPSIGLGAGFSPYGQLITIENGRLAMPYYTIDSATNTYGVYLTFSDDNGTTWGNDVAVAVSTTFRYTESTFAYANGTIVGLMRDDLAAKLTQVKSTDNGQTWTVQGLVNFGGTADVAPWLTLYEEINGELYIACAYGSRNPAKGVYLISGKWDDIVTSQSSWNILSLERLNVPTVNDFSYPNLININNSNRMLGMYYLAEADVAPTPLVSSLYLFNKTWNTTMAKLLGGNFFMDNQRLDINSTSNVIAIDINNNAYQPAATSGTVKIKFGFPRIKSGIAAYKESNNTGGIIFYNAFGYDTEVERARLTAAGNFIITGTATVATPTADAHAATKLYVDSSIAAVKDGNINVTTGSGGTTTPVLSTFYGKNGNATIFVNATAGVGEVVLESAALMAGKTVIVIKTDASVNAVTIKGSGTTNINGSNTYVISTQYDNVSIKSNGTQYYIVS